MDPATGERFGFLLERRLAGLRPADESTELTGLLERSGEARDQYLKSVEIHMDLGGAVGAGCVEENDPMARLTMNCTCGWNFFISDSAAGHEVACPSCAQPVRIPGRKPGMGSKKTPGEIAAERMRRQQLIKTVLGAAAVLLVAVGIYAAVPGTPVVPPEPKPEKSPMDVKPIQPPVVIVEPKKDEIVPIVSDPAPIPALNEKQIQELQAEVFDKVWLINMSSVLAELMRLSGRAGDYELLQESIGSHEDRIQECLKKLREVKRAPRLEPYFAKGDLLVAISSQDLEAMKREDAAQVLQAWAQNWRAGADVDQAIVRRGSQRLTITFMFPKNTMDLMLLLRHAELLASLPPASRSFDTHLLPRELKEQYQARVDALPRGYLPLLPAPDKKRMEKLLGGKRGSLDDLDWFEKRLLGVILGVFEEDARSIRGKLADLEPKIKDNPAPDAVLLKDGRRIEGKLSAAGPEKWKLQVQAITLTLSAEEIAQVLKGQGSGNELPGRYEKAKGHVSDLLQHMAWCSDKRFVNEKLYAAGQILLLDVTNDKARLMLKLPGPTLPPEK